MEIRGVNGEQVWLRTLTRRDVDAMQRWAKFTEPDLQWANFNPRSEAEKDIWYASGQDNHVRRRFAIVAADDSVIGTLGLRNISRPLGEATLGIRLGASAVGKGLGTDAITLILRFAFTEMHLHRVNLDVAQGNLRARRCYEKVGFRRVGQHTGLDSCTYIDMEITRREFNQRHRQAAASESGLRSAGQSR